MYKESKSLRRRWVGELVEDGTWAQLCVDNNEVCLKKASSGNAAMGQVVSIQRTIGDPPGPYIAEIACSASKVITTDVFNVKDRYPVNANLFVVDGKLTTNETHATEAAKKDGYDSALSLGIVVSPPSAMLSVLEFFRLS